MYPTSLPAPVVLYEEGAIFVMNKPGGLLTQAPPGIDSLEIRTKAWLKTRDEKPGKVYLGVPHRLDRPVSGAIILAKNVRASGRVAEQFRNRSVEKKYWAVVSGQTAPQATLKDWMRKIPDEAKSEIVSEDHEDAKHAELNFRTIAQTDDRSLVEVELITGRTHQIRLQLAAHGFPVLGDRLYGSAQSFGPQTQDLRSRWIALHARSIGFEHPISKVKVSQTAPMSEHWRHLTEFESELFG